MTFPQLEELVGRWVDLWSAQTVESVPPPCVNTLHGVCRQYPKEWCHRAMMLISRDIDAGRDVRSPGALLYSAARDGRLGYFPERPPMRCGHCDDGVLASRADDRCAECRRRLLDEERERREAEAARPEPEAESEAGPEDGMDEVAAVQAVMDAFKKIERQAAVERAEGKLRLRQKLDLEGTVIRRVADHNHEMQTTEDGWRYFNSMRGDFNRHWVHERVPYDVRDLEIKQMRIQAIRDTRQAIRERRRAARGESTGTEDGSGDAPAVRQQRLDFSSGSGPEPLQPPRPVLPPLRDDVPEHIAAVLPSPPAPPPVIDGGPHLLGDVVKDMVGMMHPPEGGEEPPQPGDGEPPED